MPTVAQLISRLQIDIVGPPKGIDRHLRATAKGLEFLSQSMSLLANNKAITGIPKVQTALKGLSQAAVLHFQRATRAIRDMSSALLTAQGQLVTTGQRMAGAAARANHQAMAGAGVGPAAGAAAGGRGRGARGGRTGGGGGGRLGGAAGPKPGFAGVAGSFVGMLVGGYMLGGINQFIQKSSEMELSLAELQAVTRASREEMGLYEAKIMEVAGKTPYDPQEISESLLRLRMATGNSTDALKLLGRTADVALSSFGKVSLESAARFVGQVSRSFPKGETDDLVKQMFQVGLAAGLPIEEFTKHAGRLGAATGRYQQEGGSTESFLKTFALSAGIQGQPAQTVTQLERLAGRMSDPKLIQGLASVGVNVKKDTGQFKDLGEVILEIYDRMGKNPERIQEAINAPFGERAIKPILYSVLRLNKGMEIQGQGVLKGRELWEALTQQLHLTDDVMKALGEQRLATFSGQLGLMGDELKKTAIAIGTDLLPIVKTYVKGLQGLSEAFQSIYSGGGALSTVLKAVTHSMAAGGSLFAFVAMLKGAFGLLKNVASFTGMSTILGAIPSQFGTARATAAAHGPVRQATFGAGGIGLANTALNAAGALGKFTLVLIAADLAMRAFSNVIEIFSTGFGPWWDRQKNEAAVERLTASKLGTYKGYGFSKAEASAIITEYKAKFGQKEEIGQAGGEGDIFTRNARGKAIGFAGLTDKEKWLDWRIKNNNSILYHSIRKWTEAQVIHMNFLAKQAILVQKLAENTKLMNDTFAYGTEKMNRVLSETKELASYEPKEFKWATHVQANKLMQGALKNKGLDDFQRKMITGGLAAGGDITALIEKGARGEILTTEEHARMAEMAKVRQAVLIRMEQMGLGGVTKGFYKKHGKGVLLPTAEMGSPLDILMNDYIAKTTEGGINKLHKNQGWIKEEFGMQSDPTKTKLFQQSSLGFSSWPSEARTPTGMAVPMDSLSLVAKHLGETAQAIKTYPQEYTAHIVEKTLERYTLAMATQMEKAMSAAFRKETLRVTVEGKDPLDGRRNPLKNPMH